jgi:RNA polymerase-binding transcription factor DksA
MDFEHFRKPLRKKEHDLLVEIAELNDEAKRPDGPYVGDWPGHATIEVDTNDNVAEAAIVTEMLSEVRRALQRIEDGTCGRCVVSGRPIALARLEAIPWTPYCLKHETETERQAVSTARSA